MIDETSVKSVWPFPPLCPAKACSEQKAGESGPVDEARVVGGTATIAGSDAALLAALAISHTGHAKAQSRHRQPSYGTAWIERPRRSAAPHGLTVTVNERGERRA